MTGERDELPAGWCFYKPHRGWAANRMFGARAIAKGATRAEAIAAAWRIVDAEREADDGR
jgi:hypothetical protein